MRDIKRGRIGGGRLGLVGKCEEGRGNILSLEIRKRGGKGENGN